jgi:ABC-2 type transport system ATP-binding protein
MELIIDNLSKTYANGVKALNGISLNIPQGMFGLLGPNGAGKSTFMKILAGLLEPTSGEVTLDGHDILADPMHVRARLGYLPQDFGFYPNLTGAATLEYLLRLKGIEAPGGMRRLVGELLERVNLSFAAKRKVKGYSGGMRQRLGVGQAILPSPPVLFLDEPVSALDPAGRRDVLELIGSLRGTATIFMSTHILNDVERICDRVAILDRGRLVTEAPIEELLARHARPILELDPEPGQAAAVERLVTALRSATWAREVLLEHGLIRIVVADADRAVAEVLPIVAAADVRLTRFERVRPTLEDVFLQLVGANGAARAGADKAGEA